MQLKEIHMIHIEMYNWTQTNNVSL